MKTCSAKKHKITIEDSLRFVVALNVGDEKLKKERKQNHF